MMDGEEEAASFFIVLDLLLRERFVLVSVDEAEMVFTGELFDEEADDGVGDGEEGVCFLFSFFTFLVSTVSTAWEVLFDGVNADDRSDSFTTTVDSDADDDLDDEEEEGIWEEISPPSDDVVARIDMDEEEVTVW